MDDVPPDPEQARIAALLDAVRLGRATEAERTELALYRDELPELADRIERSEAERKLGAGWLDRVDADARIQRAESSRIVVAERVVGASLAIGGYAVAVVAPPVGVTMMAVGVTLTAWSFLRMRIKTLADDPYRKVKK